MKMLVGTTVLVQDYVREHVYDKDSRGKDTVLLNGVIGKRREQLFRPLL